MSKSYLFSGCVQALMLILYCSFFKKYLKNKHSGEVCAVKEKSWLQIGSIWAAVFCVVSILLLLTMPLFVYVFSPISNVLCFLFITLSAMEAKYKYGIKSLKLTISVILAVISGALLGALLFRYFDFFLYYGGSPLRVLIEELACVCGYIIAILCVKSAVKNNFKISKLN